MQHRHQYTKYPYTNATQFLRHKACFAALTAVLIQSPPALADISPPGHAGSFRSTESTSATYPSVSLLLRSLIYSLMDILDVSDMRTAVQEQVVWLDLDAMVLISGYAISGIPQPLSAQTITEGQVDCQEALDIINTFGSELEMSGTARILLKQTIIDMRQELNHAL